MFRTFYIFCLGFALIVVVSCSFVSCSFKVDREDILSGNFGDVDTNSVELISPLDEAKALNLQTNLVWAAKPGVKTYKVYLARDVDFTQPVSGFPFSTEETSVSVTFTDDITYYWRVQSNLDADQVFSATRKIHVFDKTLYIHCPATIEECSNDGMSGNKSFPFQVINEALPVAKYLNLEVHVAGRTDSQSGTQAYNESIVLEQGLIVKGGYNAQNWTRDRDVNETIISSTDAIVVKANNIQDTTLLDGFTIQSQCSTGKCYAIHTEFSSSKFTISNNTIHGGNGDTSFVIFSDSSQSQILVNKIYAGQSKYNSYGIYNNSADTTISKNYIHGGKGGTRTYGIYNKYSQAVISQNTIHGGDIVNTSGNHGIRDEYNKTDTSQASTIFNNIIYGGTGKQTYGIYVDKATSVIQNNTINGGHGQNASTGILLSSVSDGPASAVIQNNIIFTSHGTTYRYCINEYHASGYASDPSHLQNNNLFDCATALYRDESSTNYTTLTNGKPGDADVATTTSGNINIDDSSGQLFVDINGPDDDVTTLSDNNWQLKYPPIAATCNVVFGGLDLSDDYLLDFSDISRTNNLSGLPCVPANGDAAGWSIGAYEKDE